MVMSLCYGSKQRSPIGPFQGRGEEYGGDVGLFGVAKRHVFVYILWNVGTGWALCKTQ